MSTLPSRASNIFSPCHNGPTMARRAPCCRASGRSSAPAGGSRGRAGRRSPSPTTRPRCGRRTSPGSGRGTRRGCLLAARASRPDLLVGEQPSIRPRRTSRWSSLLSGRMSAYCRSRRRLRVVPVEAVAVAVLLEELQLGHPVGLRAHTSGPVSRRVEQRCQRASTSTVCSSASEPYRRSTNAPARSANPSAALGRSACVHHAVPLCVAVSGHATRCASPRPTHQQRQVGQRFQPGFDQREYQRGHAHLHIRGGFGKICVADDDVKAPVLLGGRGARRGC